MNLRETTGTALVIAVLCLTAPAHADRELIQLDFRGGASCPDRTEFVRRVQAITPKAELAQAEELGAARRRFDIHVTRAPGGVKGELTIDDQGSKTMRSVTGKTCDEVIGALALATALAVDPDALSASPSASPTPEVLLLEESPIEPVPPPKPHPPPPVRRPPPPERPQPRPPTPVPTRHRHLFDLNLGARMGSALAAFPFAEGFVQLGSSRLAPLELYVGGAYGPAQRDTEARFRSIVGWAGTGYRILDLEPVSVWARAAFELGQIRATGVAIEPSRSVQRTWAAVDVGASARLDALGAADWLFFQADASLRAPVTLQRYVVQEMNGSYRELHQVPSLGYLLGLSVGMHFL